MPLSTQLIAVTAMLVNFFFPLLSMFVFMAKGVRVAQQTEHHPVLYGIASSIVGLLIGFAFAVAINFVVENGVGICVRQIVCQAVYPSGKSSGTSCNVYDCQTNR